MDDDAVWAAIDQQRLRTAELLEGLTEEQWNHPSLCEGWTVRDVAAHLTLQQLGPGTALLAALRHPGSLKRMTREYARDRAALPTDRLIARIRAMVGSRRHNVGVSALGALTDALVHAQDIAVPLGIDLPVPGEAAAAAAETVWSQGSRSKALVFGKLPLDGLRLTATDAAWSVGEGPEVKGPAIALLLVLTGRPAGLDRLTGDGADALRRRLALV